MRWSVLVAFSTAGERAEADKDDRVGGTSVLAMLSRRLDDILVGLVVGLPGVVPGLVPSVPFSLVTRPLSWTYLDEREW